MHDLKQNGVSDKDYKTLNKNNYNRIIDQVFEETNLCYLTVNVKDDRIIEMLLWKDEIDNIRKIINFPCKYKLQRSQTRANKFEIKVSTLSQMFQGVYKNLDEEEFIEYMKKVLQGY